jgi:guanine deaminase
MESGLMRLRARVLSPATPELLTWLPDALVVIDEGRLSHVGPWTGGPFDEDLRHGVLTPGFVDAHVHFPQTRIIGAASGPLLDWLRASTFPEEARFADPAHAASVAHIFTRALAAAGTTLAMIYGSVHAEAAHALFLALDEAGLRGLAGPVLMDEGGPEELMRGPDRALADLDALVDTWHGRDGRLQVAVLPRFGLSCSPQMLRRAGELAHRRGLWVSTHLSENTEECAATTRKFDTADYLRVYEDAGLVHDRAVYAHCIHLTDSEWRRMADAKAVIAHCPDSNDFLGSGGMPIERVLSDGHPLALGTDVAAGRTFRIPRIVSSAHDNALRRGVRVPPARWLWQATRGGALALGHPHVGQITAGLDADLVLHELPAWVDDPEGAMSWLLFHHDAPRPLATWVRGRRVWERASS